MVDLRRTILIPLAPRTQRGTALKVVARARVSALPEVLQIHSWLHDHFAEGAACRHRLYALHGAAIQAQPSQVTPAPTASRNAQIALRHRECCPQDVPRTSSGVHPVTPGKGRFLRAAPAAPWKSVRDCVAYGSACTQPVGAPGCRDHSTAASNSFVWARLMNDAQSAGQMSRGHQTCRGWLRRMLTAQSFNPDVQLRMTLIGGAVVSRAMLTRKRFPSALGM